MPLLLVEAAHQEVDLVVAPPVGMVLFAQAAGTLAPMNRNVCHDPSSITPRTGAAEDIVCKPLEVIPGRAFTDPFGRK